MESSYRFDIIARILCAKFAHNDSLETEIKFKKFALVSKAI
jgi:hypothetical protein